MALAPSGGALIVGMSSGGLRRFQIDVTGGAPRLIEVTGARGAAAAAAAFDGAAACLPAAVCCCCCC